MTTLNIIAIALASTAILLSLVNIRSHWVADFRYKWLIALKSDPDALALFAKRVPSFKKMLWSFRKLTDQNWIPADIRAAKYRAEMDPDHRKALDKYIGVRKKLKT